MKNGYIEISDYFQHIGSLSSRDYREMNKIRNTINSFQTRKEQFEYIDNRRRSSFYVDEDYRIFKIPKSAKVNIKHGDNIDNKYYNGSNKEEFSESIYYKKDRNGNYKRKRNGEIKSYGKVGKAGINFANNMKKSKAAKTIKFIFQNLKLILILLWICVIVINITLGIFYFTGTINSIGHSPFILCGDEEIAGNTTININDADTDKISSPDYVAQVAVSVLKAKGWKQNAIIGMLSYILQEGSGFGFFTYEQYWLIGGPKGSNNPYDKTLDNQKWLDWLNSSTAENDICSNDSVNYSLGNYAIGLGLIGWSDVWSGGTKQYHLATDFINRATEKGKYWQDPAFQIEDLAEKIYDYKYDVDWADPKTFSGSSREYCLRVTATIGMGAWNWTDQNYYMTAHESHVTEATSYYNQYKNSTAVIDGIEISGSTKNLCDSLNDDTTDSNTNRANFTPRLEQPAGNDRHYFSGENIFYASGYGMPNCTAYAYGRAYEILGTKPNLCGGNAEQWYDYNKNGGYYPYGNKAKLGAIAVWSHPGGGHVAVVEKIENGQITFSNSAYARYDLFFYTNTVAEDDPNANIDDTWTLLGYIYI